MNSSSDNAWFETTILILATIGLENNNKHFSLGQ